MDKRHFIMKAGKLLAAVFSLNFISGKIWAQGSRKPQKVKMLTRDGKLVWVDESLLDSKKAAPSISNKSLLSWIKSQKNED